MRRSEQQKDVKKKNNNNNPKIFSYEALQREVDLGFKHFENTKLRMMKTNLCNLCKRVTDRLLQRGELLLSSLDLLLQPPALLLQSQELLSGLDQILLILAYPLFLLLVLQLQ